MGIGKDVGSVEVILDQLCLPLSFQDHALDLGWELVVTLSSRVKELNLVSAS
jgi:hypothetical protein